MIKRVAAEEVEIIALHVYACLSAPFIVSFYLILMVLSLVNLGICRRWSILFV